jgi:hypothetical protein
MSSPSSARSSAFAFHDEFVAIVRAAAAPLPPSARSKFYELVDRELGTRELGPGLVARVCREVQRFIAVDDATSSIDGRR